MKKALKFAVVVLSCVLLLSSALTAQEYHKIKIVLKNGVTQEGSKGNITSDKVTFTQGSAVQNINLDDVQMVMAKKGLAGKFAGYGCGTCAGIGGVVYAASGSELSSEEQSQYLLGLVLWMGIFACGGALIGVAADSWNTVYMAPAQSSIWDNMKLSCAADPKKGYQLVVSYLW